MTRFNPETKVFAHYTHNPSDTNSLSHNKVCDVIVDENGILWLATVGGGINRFDPKSGRFTHYRHDPQDPNSLSNRFDGHSTGRGNRWH